MSLDYVSTNVKDVRKTARRPTDMMAFWDCAGVEWTREQYYYLGMILLWHLDPVVHDR